MGAARQHPAPLIRAEAARDVLVQRGDHHATAVDGWLAQALADRSGHNADPTAREAAVARLPETVTARAELLAALAATGAPVRDDEMPFAGLLAGADPDAVIRSSQGELRGPPCFACSKRFPEPGSWERPGPGCLSGCRADAELSSELDRSTSDLDDHRGSVT